eukprot:sb/3466620/
MALQNHRPLTHLGEVDIMLTEPTEPSRKPIRARYFDHVTGFQTVEHHKLLSPPLKLSYPSAVDISGTWTYSARAIRRFEERQTVRIRVFDLDDGGQSIGMADFLGELEIPLGQIVSVGSLSKPLHHPRFSECGTISVSAVEIGGSNEIVCLKFEGVGLDKKDFFGKSDPYFELGRENPDGTFATIYRSETIECTLNPRWNLLEIGSKRLCQNHPEQNILFSCYDYDDDGSHDFIGHFTTNLTELRERSRSDDTCKVGFFEVVTLWVAREFLFARRNLVLALTPLFLSQFGRTKVLRTPKIMLFPVIPGFLPKSKSKWGLSHANTTPRDKRG